MVFKRVRQHRTFKNTFVCRAGRRQLISDFVSPLSAASPKESKKHHLNAVTSKLSAPEPQKGFRTHDPPLQTSIFAKTLNICPIGVFLDALDSSPRQRFNESNKFKIRSFLVAIVHRAVRRQRISDFVSPIVCS